VKRLGIAVLVAAALYLALGFYIVRGNEKVAVRWFGRAVRTDAGRLALATSGLHFALPWPFSQLERVRPSEIRTLTIGLNESDDAAASSFLTAVETADRSAFLTGDKNILHLQISAQYHVSEEALGDFLFRSVTPERQLERIVESVATDLFARSGVDFVHPLGQVELNGRLTAGVRRLAEDQRLGLEIDDVAINAVYPPVLVKAWFVDVTNARTEKVNSINNANAYAERSRAASTALVRQTLDEAASYRQETVESARAQADSFTRMIEQFRREAHSGTRTYVQAREIALTRYYLNTMRDVLKTVSAKVLLDSGETSDLTIFARPEAPARPEARGASKGER
jgi:modulator of FtsH protease HflK